MSYGLEYKNVDGWATLAYSIYLADDGNKLTMHCDLYHSRPINGAPLCSEAAACKTHEQVLAFLEKLHSGDFGEKRRVIFYTSHDNNSEYPEHNRVKKSGWRTHDCSLEKQIDFVKQQIELRKVKSSS